MKYTAEVKINLPRTKVIELFDNPEHLKEWQPGLKSYTRLDGSPGEEGARSELVYEGRKGDLVMTEIVTARQLPEKLVLTYTSRGVYNQVENWFMELEPGLTLWRSVNIFRFRGLMMFMDPFMKQAFIHHTILNMDRFKLFAEHPENY